MKIDFCGHEFLLHPSGVLFWPDKSLLIVSDLHLEKASHFAGRGYFLPPYDSRETLERLDKAIQELLPSRLLILGDCFHDPRGFDRLPENERALFKKFLSYDAIWINGNHDGDFVPDGCAAHDAYILDGITFRHEAIDGGPREISGHFHPKAEIIHKQGRVSRPCFVEDGNKMILPSFGAYTGGLFVDDPSIAGHFTKEKRIYILGDKKIYFFQ